MIDDLSEPNKTSVRSGEMKMIERSKFPMISERGWQTLREQFKKRVPTKVTSTYLVEVLSLPSDKGVRSNVVAPLTQMMIIDENGATTERAYLWRDDERYGDVCRDIINEVYPEEVKDLFEDETQINGFKQWIMRSNRVGESSAQKVASTYFMLLKGAKGINEMDAKILRAEKVVEKGKEQPPKVQNKSAKRIIETAAEIRAGSFCVNINISSETDVEKVREILLVVKEIMGD